MNKQPAHVLLIEDNPGDADLMRLRLIEGGYPVEVKCVNRLSDGLASLSQHFAVGDSPRLESSRQPRGGNLSQDPEGRA